MWKSVGKVKSWGILRGLNYSLQPLNLSVQLGYKDVAKQMWPGSWTEQKEIFFKYQFVKCTYWTDFLSHAVIVCASSFLEPLESAWKQAGGSRLVSNTLITKMAK